ncbi:hypothetical protein B0H67DRAFT_495926 [Lasiosphaeris hirsuta]|uniref:N-acetyltransferase domain-containing protein n=1 Tax=Lasiosphaeris hirsuta TaxID=260670 RepID=A0AA40A1Z0_9PEZI|nr:hypothetical protein B0H67DRAFT_495926 [Lasiosphaeris hirsuta]
MPKPLPQGLEVRQARPEDVSSLARLLVHSPDDGTLYQFPHVLEYPDEMHKLHAGWLCSTVCSPTTLVRVAVLPKDGKQAIVGFSSWMKREADPGSEGSTRLAELNRVTFTERMQTEETPPLAKERKALEADEKHSEAVRRVRKQAPPSLTASVPSYELNGLAVHADYQGYGIGSLLVRWGLGRAAEDGLPVFATGEAQGVDFYEKALGFRRVLGTEFWLDKDGQDISGSDVKQGGNEEWKKVNGGLSGAEMVWCPKGYEIDIRGEVYRG